MTGTTGGRWREFSAIAMFALRAGVEALSHNALRAGLTSLGILFGVASVIAMLAIGRGAEQEILEQMRLLGSNNIIVKPIVEQKEEAAQAAGEKQPRPPGMPSHPVSRPRVRIDRWPPEGMPENLLASAADKLSAIVVQWPDNLPSGAIHADLFPNNVLFVGDELTGVIDFYFACHDLYAYDLAVCLNSWCFDSDGSFNITKSTALIKGYQTRRPLEADEIDSLAILCSGAAMRFFLTRLYDWIHTPADALVKPLNPLEYWQKLRIHEKAQSPQAYGIW